MPPRPNYFLFRSSPLTDGVLEGSTQICAAHRRVPEHDLSASKRSLVAARHVVFRPGALFGLRGPPYIFHGRGIHSRCRARMPGETGKAWPSDAGRCWLGVSRTCAGWYGQCLRQGLGSSHVAWQMRSPSCCKSISAASTSMRLGMDDLGVQMTLTTSCYGYDILDEAYIISMRLISML